MVRNIIPENTLGLSEDLLKYRFEQFLAVRDRDNPQRRTLPNVLVVKLRDRHIKSRTNAVTHFPQDGTLFFEGVGVRYLNFQG